ncbi:MAG: hypothetical protein R3240_13745 [Gammaproteobacteria bacterium]|nr:hypothetical protein [Gammaproteobacteria bacterium]
MEILNNTAAQSIVLDTLNPGGVSDLQTPQENQHPATAHAHSGENPNYIGNIQPEQAREFLASHVNRKLSEITSPYNVEQQPAYHTPFNNELQLENHLKESISQASLRESSHLNIAKQVSTAFNEAQNILTNSMNLPDNLQNEFTRIQYSLSDFIARLNSLAKDGVNIDMQQNKTQDGQVMEVETREGKIITIDLSRFTNQKSNDVKLYENQSNASTSATTPGTLLDKIL